MVRLLEEQCHLSEDDSQKVILKKPEEIPADSLQNPADPDATYGHQGKGYKASLAETCRLHLLSDPNQRANFGKLGSYDAIKIPSGSSRDGKNPMGGNRKGISYCAVMPHKIQLHPLSNAVFLADFLPDLPGWAKSFSKNAWEPMSVAPIYFKAKSGIKARRREKTQERLIKPSPRSFFKPNISSMRCCDHAFGRFSRRPARGIRSGHWLAPPEEPPVGGTIGARHRSESRRRRCP